MLIYPLSQPHIYQINMALQYLDAVSNPYFVILRSSGGVFEGSWSMANTMRYQQGDPSSAILVGDDGTQMGLTINFDEIDWASCTPALVNSSTDEKIMTYLNTLFTGQLGTYVPPTIIEQMIFSTEPIQEIDFTVSATYYIPLNGNYLDLASAAYTIDQANMVIPVTGSFDGLKVSCTEYSASKSANITLIVNGAPVSQVLAVNGAGVLSSPVGSISVTADDLVCLELEVPVGATGTAMLSCVSSLFTPAT